MSIGLEYGVERDYERRSTELMVIIKIPDTIQYRGTKQIRDDMCAVLGLHPEAPVSETITALGGLVALLEGPRNASLPTHKGEYRNN
jgi:hypothetical protein